jgi:hypothetical protein
MSLPSSKPKPKKCANPACGKDFTPTFNTAQKVCSFTCGLAIKHVNQERARKSLAQIERTEIKVRKEKLKSRAEHLKDTQIAFNAWVRERDAEMPCISCGRHHQGKYDAGHYRTVGSNPALRFEPLNCHRQCSPCNTRLSGNIVNYRIELVRRIGAEAVEWLEGPHSARKYTVEELKVMTAEYRAKTKKLKKGQAA